MPSPYSYAVVYHLSVYGTNRYLPLTRVFLEISMCSIRDFKYIPGTLFIRERGDIYETS